MFYCTWWAIVYGWTGFCLSSIVHTRPCKYIYIYIYICMSTTTSAYTYLQLRMLVATGLALVCSPSWNLWWMLPNKFVLNLTLWFHFKLNHPVKHLRQSKPNGSNPKTAYGEIELRAWWKLNSMVVSYNLDCRQLVPRQCVALKKNKEAACLCRTSCSQEKMTCLIWP